MMLKLVHFSNPFGMTFILKLDLPNSCIVRWESTFLVCEMRQKFCDLI